MKQAIARYSKQLSLQRQNPQAAQHHVTLKRELNHLSAALEKLNSRVIRIAVFGLVSRGKSALINALVGQKRLQTGPLHGVTRWPRSVYWSPSHSEADLQVELIDTPGLEEIDGDVRTSMAEEVAQQSDLILFVVAGDLTRTEYQALRQLQHSHKPIILVFNKIDLYPDQERSSIVEKINTLIATDAHSDGGVSPLRSLTIDDVVRVAAEPAPLQVRTEWPDGRVTYEWETPSPQIGELRDRLTQILKQEGKLLLALNILRESRAIETTIAQETLDLYHDEAEDLILKFAAGKSVVVAANPIAIFDLVGGAAADLVMIRSLARLYGLPMTGYEAGKLWNAIVWSSLGLAAGEVGSGLLLGFGKSTAAIFSTLDGVSGLAAYSTAAIAQATLAGYGAYRVGKAAQAYLENGCSWGPRGISTVIQDILKQLNQDTVMARLQNEIEQLQHNGDVADSAYSTVYAPLE